MRAQFISSFQEGKKTAAVLANSSIINLPLSAAVKKIELQSVNITNSQVKKRHKYINN